MDDSYQNGAHRIDGVEDGAQIVHPLLDRWQRAAMGRDPKAPYRGGRAR